MIRDEESLPFLAFSKDALSVDFIDSIERKYAPLWDNDQYLRDALSDIDNVFQKEAVAARLLTKEQLALGVHDWVKFGSLTLKLLKKFNKHAQEHLLSESESDDDEMLEDSAVSWEPSDLMLAIKGLDHNYLIMVVAYKMLTRAYVDKTRAMHDWEKTGKAIFNALYQYTLNPKTAYWRAQELMEEIAGLDSPYPISLIASKRLKRAQVILDVPKSFWHEPLAERVTNIIERYAYIDENVKDEHAATIWRASDLWRHIITLKNIFQMLVIAEHLISKEQTEGFNELREILDL